MTALGIHAGPFPGANEIALGRNGFHPLVEIAAFQIGDGKGVERRENRDGNEDSDHHCRVCQSCGELLHDRSPP